MKLKSLFLCMLGAALFVGCNNEIDGPGGQNSDPDAPVEGLPIYASLSFKVGKNGNTYAGATDVQSTLHEEAVRDAALYVYKSDASGTTPQCAVYLAIGTTGNGANRTVTLKTTSGQKVIFVAANVNQNPTNAEMLNVTGLGVVSSVLNITADNLNHILYSSSATAFSTTAPTAPLYADFADGLIKNFAMNQIYGDGSGSYGAVLPTPAANAAFMSNWDGPNDVATSSTHVSAAKFLLYPDVDSVSSRPTFPSPSYDGNKNQLQIYVQRAFAKVSLKFGFAAVSQAAPSVPVGLVGKYYPAGVGLGADGRFFPWGSAGNAYWSLGNITTAELPFQQYVNGVVQDMFYQETSDSIPQVANAANKWFLHYDNTRVFPFSASINFYPNRGVITVTNTKSTMIASGNNQNFTPDASTNQLNYNYAYAIENARLDPVAHDHGAYVIVGGFYQPKSVLTSINRSNVSSNAPVMGFNGATLTGSETSGSTVSGTDYSWVPTANDTLYYIADDKIFIKGIENLMAYYAWAPSQMKNITAGDAWLTANPGGIITAAAVYAYTPGSGAEFGQDVVDAINKDRKDEVLFSYFEGQCFYRIFIKDEKSASTKDRAVVLRNHIYDINITSIKGPGIADPNEILIPGKPILEQDTYVSATIEVLNWHKVDQNEDVDNQ